MFENEKNQNDIVSSELINSYDIEYVFNDKPINRIKTKPGVEKKLEKLDKLKKKLEKIENCELKSYAKNMVFSDGNPKSKIMLIGEAPGSSEDQEGLPFVGRAGKMLDKILYAINRKRGDGVYIANVIKCRPPNNRDPLSSEVKKCEPYLIEQISQIQPKLIVALGRVAGKTLLKMDVPLKEMRDKTHDYNGTPLRVTFHPAALLRNSNFKK